MMNYAAILDPNFGFLCIEKNLQNDWKKKLADFIRADSLPIDDLHCSRTSSSGSSNNSKTDKQNYEENTKEWTILHENADKEETDIVKIEIQNYEAKAKLLKRSIERNILIMRNIKTVKEYLMQMFMNFGEKTVRIFHFYLTKL